MSSIIYQSPTLHGSVSDLSVLSPWSVSPNWTTDELHCPSSADNPPAMQETWVRSLGWEDRLEKGKATHSSVLA